MKKEIQEYLDSDETCLYESAHGDVIFVDFESDTHNILLYDVLIVQGDNLRIFSLPMLFFKDSEAKEEIEELKEIENSLIDDAFTEVWQLKKLEELIIKIETQ